VISPWVLREIADNLRDRSDAARESKSLRRRVLIETVVSVSIGAEINMPCGIWVASPLQGEGEGEGFFRISAAEASKPLTSVLSPLPKGRGQKSRRVSFISQTDNYQHYP
jgi:hypothetical protein